MSILSTVDRTIASQYFDWKEFELNNNSGIDEDEAKSRLFLAIETYLYDLKNSISQYAEDGGNIEGVSGVIQEFNKNVKDYADEFGVEGLVSKENFVKMMGHLVTR